MSATQDWFSVKLCAQAHTRRPVRRKFSLCLWRLVPVWPGSVTVRPASSRNACVKPALPACCKAEIRSSFAYTLLFVPSISRFGDPPIHIIMHDIKLVHPARDFRFWSQALVMAIRESTLTTFCFLGNMQSNAQHWRIATVFRKHSNLMTN